MINELALRLAAARAHGMLSVLAKDGEQIHREQAASIVNEISELLWPGDPYYKVELESSDA